MTLEIILENKRDEYLIQVLEEGTTELESLKTKKYLTENLNLIEKILVEEGLLDTLKNHGGKIATGVGLGAAAAYGMDHSDEVKDALHTGMDKAKEMYHGATDNKPETTDNKPATPAVDKNSTGYKQTHITDDQGSSKYMKKLGVTDKTSLEAYNKAHPGHKDFSMGNNFVKNLSKKAVL